MRRGFQFHLDPSPLVFCKRAVGVNGGLQRFFLGEKLFRTNDPAPDELDHFRHIAAMIAISGLESDVFLKDFFDGKALHRRRIDADDRNRSRLRDRLDGPFERLRWGSARLKGFVPRHSFLRDSFKLLLE